MAKLRQGLAVGVAAILMTMAAATTASAQVFGTFPWQMQPYCNVVTLTLTSAPAGFTLDGTDDQCGATNKAGAVGIGSFNASGNVTLNFSIVTAPAGKPVHVSAVVSPANGNGTWTDSVGNAGTFAFFGAATGLPARPFPTSGLAPAIITTTELAANAVTGAKVADASLTSADLLDGPRSAFAGGEQALALTPTDVVVRTVSLSAPTSGRVLVSVSGTFEFQDATATSEAGRCSITTTSAIEDPAIFAGGDGGTIAAAYDAFGAVRAFNVTAGLFTVNLVCDEFAGVVTLRNSNLTALFVPQ